MVAVIDYDAGNIKSVQNAIEYLGGECIITRDSDIIMKCDKAILPGVGAFGDAMHRLEEYRLVQTIKDFVNTGKPFMGICLGLQVLFEDSEESPGVEGLGILKGHIKRIPDSTEFKVPQIGWNSIDINPASRLLSVTPDGSYVYFVHSYYLEAEDESIVSSTTEYNTHIHASVEKDNVFACQFHPEKSSDIGLNILKNFLFNM